MMNEIKIENLSKSYQEVTALDKVNLTLSEGIYGLLGHNGAGKSTIIRILATLLEETGGSVLYNGENIHDLGKRYRAVLGYMPQQQSLIASMTVESFMYYMASLKGMSSGSRDAILDILKKTNIYDFRRRKIGVLSGGMKQRVLIAQALLNDPRVLLLDEPTAGLDPIERRSFRELIAHVSKGKIVVLATHVISDVEFIANEIILLKKGVLLAKKSQSELLQSTRVYEMFESLDALAENDPSLKVVNRLPIHGRVRVRYISKKHYDNQVTTTLDDVYIDWLG